MTWKKFPSQALQSLANTPTLTDVWVPRWTNTFGTDILPLDTPQLLTGLPVDDKQDLGIEETYEKEKILIWRSFDQSYLN